MCSSDLILPRWWASIWTSVLLGLVVLAGFILLIVPGIIWCIGYSFTIEAVALRGLAGQEALKYSKNLVRGQWWYVFGVILVVNMIGLMVGGGVGLGLGFLPHFQVISMAVDTICDLISALFLVMTTVFFLNLDYRYRAKAVADAVPSASPAGN